MNLSQKKYYQQVNTNKTGLSLWEYPVLPHIVKGSKILELGGGNGFFAEYLTNNFQADVTVVELSDNNIQALAKKNIKYCQADLEKAELPFAENSFDCIIMLEVIEHLFNHYGALKEIQRLLKPSGKLIISTHNAFNI
ncbi:MAG: class I SAM-dependent methyltransferase, partial [Candidatus Margulisbacteria bacterium]|nr:class I SAM-dependent methyltransferase [Candidatus Margulisiibacteriota bacterium]